MLISVIYKQITTIKELSKINNYFILQRHKGGGHIRSAAFCFFFNPWLLFSLTQTPPEWSSSFTAQLCPASHLKSISRQIPDISPGRLQAHAIICGVALQARPGQWTVLF
jgi:hypothetical protein